MKVHLARMATKAYFRTLQHAPFEREQLHTSVLSRISHRSWIQDLIQDQGLGYLEGPLDVVPLHRRWEHNYEVDYSSMHPDNPSRGIPDIRGVNIYTDGSRNELSSGSGVAILDGGQVSTTLDGEDMIYDYHLGGQTTVFQSEVFAQKMAATLIINGSYGDDDWVCGRPITIHTDNQASILALDNVWVKSLLVKQTMDLLDRAAKCCKSLTIRWVKSHSEHRGNVLADTAARKGRDDEVEPDWETPLLAKAVMHSEINKMATRLWENEWNEVIGCRQTRHWFPTGPRKNFARNIVFRSKIMVGQLVQILTGHTFLKRHQAIIDESERQRIIAANDYENADDDGNAIIDAPDPTCSRCDAGGEETPLHILTECEALGDLRRAIFGKWELVAPGETPDFSDIPVHQVVSFFREAKFETLVMRPFLQEYYPAKLNKDGSNQGLVDARKNTWKRGDEYLAKYLYHIKTRDELSNNLPI